MVRTLQISHTYQLTRDLGINSALLAGLLRQLFRFQVLTISVDYGQLYGQWEI